MSKNHQVTTFFYFVEKNNLKKEKKRRRKHQQNKNIGGSISFLYLLFNLDVHLIALEKSRHLIVQYDIAFNSLLINDGVSDTSTATAIPSYRHGNTVFDELQALFASHIWSVVGVQIAHGVYATRTADVYVFTHDHAALWHHIDLLDTHRKNTIRTKIFGGFKAKF